MNTTTVSPGGDEFPGGYDDFSCKVAGIEKLNLPAGTLDTYRVDCSGLYRSGPNNSSGSFVERHWYSPEYNAEVSERQMFSGKFGRFSYDGFELVKVESLYVAEVAKYSHAGRPSAVKSPLTLGLRMFNQRGQLAVSPS